LSIEDYVKFLGWRKDVSEILQILDVFVQTSLWEGLSLSIMEAMASGKPVIITNIKGNNELVVDGRTGFLVAPNDYDELANRIVAVLKNKKLANNLGTSGRLRIKQNYNIQSYVEKIENIYDKTLFC